MLQLGGFKALRTLMGDTLELSIIEIAFPSKGSQKCITESQDATNRIEGMNESDRSDFR